MRSGAGVWRDRATNGNFAKARWGNDARQPQITSPLDLVNRLMAINGTEICRTLFHQACCGHLKEKHRPTNLLWAYSGSNMMAVMAGYGAGGERPLAIMTPFCIFRGMAAQGAVINGYDDSLV